MPISHNINTKSLARIAAIQVIYQFENESTKSEDKRRSEQSEDNKEQIDFLLKKIIEFYKDKEIKSDFDLEQQTRIKIKPSYNYLKQLVELTYENMPSIDQIIYVHLKDNWQLENLPTLLLALLRVAICEIKYFPETPRKYTDIASDMLDVDEIGFVNSLLDKYSASCR